MKPIQENDYTKYLTPYKDESLGRFGIMALISSKCPLALINSMCVELGAYYELKTHSLVLFEVCCSLSSKSGMQ